MPSTTEIIPTTKPPLVNVISFTSYIRCIYALKFGQYRTLFCLANSSVSSMPYMQSLFVRPRLCFGLPSDSASRRTPLPSANSSYCHACSGLSLPCCIACRFRVSVQLCHRRTTHYGPVKLIASQSGECSIMPLILRENRL